MKPIGKCTLEEIKALCEQRWDSDDIYAPCVDCQCERLCRDIQMMPMDWNFEFYDAKQVNYVPARPRICNVLGVDVGEKFQIDGCNADFQILPSGDIISCELSKNEVRRYVLVAINHPERIIHGSH